VRANAGHVADEDRAILLYQLPHVRR